MGLPGETSSPVVGFSQFWYQLVGVEDRPWSWLMRNHSGVEGALDALQHFVRTAKRVRLRAPWADFDPTWARHGDDVVLGQKRVMKWCIKKGVRLLATAPSKAHSTRGGRSVDRAPAT